jgi:galactose mutarotase-like enzyme
VSILNKLKNNLLSISVNPIGAELSAITSVHKKTEFMWDANPEIWANYAPNLFPIVGALKNDTYIFEGSSYQLPKHGFIRYNTDIILVSQSDNELVYLLKSNSKTLEQYPFQFKYYVKYYLNDNQLKVTYKVENVDTKNIYFSLGGHPAFKCPLYHGEAYTDYLLEFEKEESEETHRLDLSSGLLNHTSESVLFTSKTINLNAALFDKDALIFKTLNSKKITLKHQTKGDVLSMSFQDFPFYGIWAKPKANYVCLEPWLGIADSIDTNQDFKTKEGILTLEPNKSFSASYHIEIDMNHLV